MKVRVHVRDPGRRRAAFEVLREKDVLLGVDADGALVVQAEKCDGTWLSLWVARVGGELEPEAVA